MADLIRVIEGLLADMQQRGAHWKGFLDKLAVINMAHHQVREVLLQLIGPRDRGKTTQQPTHLMPATQIMVELRPLLRQYTVYPKYVDNPGIENGARPRPSRLTAYPGIEGAQQQQQWLILCVPWLLLFLWCCCSPA